jgi:hypothetical protein
MTGVRHANGRLPARGGSVPRRCSSRPRSRSRSARALPTARCACRNPTREVPSGLVAMHTGRGDRGSWRLGFRSAMRNVGDGLLLIEGRRPGGCERAMVATQGSGFSPPRRPHARASWPPGPHGPGPLGRRRRPRPCRRSPRNATWRAPNVASVSANSQAANSAAGRIRPTSSALRKAITRPGDGRRPRRASSARSRRGG